ncbi:MAG: DEAD/DEAH box helicase [Candidatus Cloacimonetes bacterium]|jgi:superfamily II DNA or RNA helicase|nr:DEAD/DEAH box helicase [Candidatus Cloacimonadota bacterium]MCB5260741.1 DEAD/DEAH box helicase [Candidatus Cloacimonadota bacterium]MCK9242814.1 DEAD/DEAH box helicase [Candidatus Cloacimonadota bacterium]
MNSEYNDLMVKLESTLKRISELEAENSRLRNLVVGDNQAVASNSDKSETSQKSQQDKQTITERKLSAPTTINNTSSPEEKVLLFRSLFQGREDLFAIRWVGKDNKSGYSPACSNDWKLGVCGKYKKIPCANCANRKLIPLDDKQIYRHLSGEITIGIYPLFEDDSCRLLAIDFDKKSWQEDVKALIEICQIYQIPAFVEISRSGNGAHVWLFFEEKISAIQARKLGTALLTKALELRHQIGFDSYDRLFPNQDTMPKGGFGNLIALPLQKKARESGNSEFVDHQFNRIEDQWNLLAQVEKISKFKVNAILTEILAGQGALGLSQRTVSDTDEPMPWEPTIAQPEEYKDLPGQIQIILSNTIYIEKAGLPQKLMSSIIRLAAFQNPEFYRAQAMRMPIYKIPRVINLSAETDKHLSIPRGCQDDLTKLLMPLNIEQVHNDLRYAGEQISASFLGKLSPQQLVAGNEMLQHDNGILSATTAFGKTVVAIWMIAQRQTNTLIVVHRRQLLEQWIERLKCFLNEPEVGQIGAGRDKRTGKIDVAIIQSLYHKRKVKELVKNYGMVIVDECHHISAFSFEQVLKAVRAKYVYGLTATPIRRDGQHPIVYMQCGPIRYVVDAKSQLKLRLFSHKVIVRYTDFKSVITPDRAEVKITEIYQALVDDPIRNDMILDDIISAIVAGRSPLILTERTAHVEFFTSKLAGFSKHVIALRGGMGRKQLKAVMERLHSIPEEDERVIIATGKYIGEGFDDSRLDTLFLTMPVSWKGVLQQYVGRLHRAHDNKTEVVIYDYVDREEPMLARMFKKRVKGYEGMGYVISGTT